MAPKSSIVFELLSEAQGPERAETYYRDKIQQRPLYLKPTPRDESVPNARDSRQQKREIEKNRKRKSPGKPRPLSAKQKRALQIYAIPREQQKYEIYVPLWKLWCGYIREVLGLDRKDSVYGRFVDARGAGPLLTSADYHGALLEVVRSGCVSRVGVKGIVVRDTKSTFEIITKGNCLKVIPKEHTIFRFEVPLEEQKASANDGTGSGQVQKANPKPLVFELHGANFEQRPTDRATRKFVLHLPPDL